MQCRYIKCLLFEFERNATDNRSGETLCFIDSVALFSILTSYKHSRGGHGDPLQYSCLKNSTDRSLEGYSPRGCKESDTM